MQTALADFIRDTHEGREADAILRACVHCGFCTATCPTYLLLGDELDGPRGRIYLIKEMLEGGEVTGEDARCISIAASPAAAARPRVLRVSSTVGSSTSAGTWSISARRARSPRAPAAGSSAKRFCRAALFAFALGDGPPAEARAAGASCARRFRMRARAGVWPAATHRRKMLALDTLRSGRARARHRCRARPRARPDRHLAVARLGGRLLRRLAASSERRGACARHHPAQHRCLVAARRPRCRGDRRDRRAAAASWSRTTAGCSSTTRATGSGRSGSRASRATRSR